MLPHSLTHTCLTLSLTVAVLTAGDARAQCSAEKFLPPLPKQGGQFGTVALDATWLAVTEWSYARYAGAVHVYDKASGTLHATLMASDAAPFAYLGSSVALRDGIVATGAVKAGPGGRVYLFDAAQGSELLALDPIGTLGVQPDFGARVELAGGRVFVGAPGNHYLYAPDDGTVHVFAPSTGAPLYRLEAPEPSEGAWLGVHSMFGAAMAADGDLLLVGAPFAGSRGGAYVYDAASGALLHRLQIPATPTYSFGAVVDLIGDRAYVQAAGSTYSAISVYDAPSGTYLFDVTHPVSPGATGFGASVSGNAYWFAVGQAGANPAYFESKVHLYDAASGAWIGKLTGLPAERAVQFGISLAVHGTHIAVGDTSDNSTAPGAGAAYLFELGDCP